MGGRSGGELTRIFEEVARGGGRAAGQLLPVVHAELRAPADRYLLHEQGHTLGATALVHEAYLNLLDQTDVKWRSKPLKLPAMDEAMERLAREEPVESRVVELRFSGGTLIKKVAEVFGISDRTVWGHWNSARAWLCWEVTRGDIRAPGGAQP